MVILRKCQFSRKMHIGSTRGRVQEVLKTGKTMRGLKMATAAVAAAGLAILLAVSGVDGWSTDMYYYSSSYTSYSYYDYSSWDDDDDDTYTLCTVTTTITRAFWAEE